MYIQIFINIEINSPALFKILVIDNKILNIGLNIGNIKVIIEAGSTICDIQGTNINLIRIDEIFNSRLI